ncbi:MAG: response regulator [Desulfopila sp.]
MMSQKDPYRIILADGQVSVRRAMRHFLAQTADLTVVGEVESSMELIVLLTRIPVDLVVVDIAMTSIAGLATVSHIVARYPGVKILVVSRLEALNHAHQVMLAGADGYLVKEEAEQDLLAAIDTIRAGGRYLSEQLGSELMGKEGPFLPGKKGCSLQTLTCREREVLQLVVEGYTSKQMADKLGLSSRTVDHHRSRLLQKFGMANSVALVAFAVGSGLVVPARY